MNTPAEVAKNYVAAGALKTKMEFSRLMVLSIMAGMFIAFAGAASTTASVSVASASIARLVGALVFPAGLAMVLVAGSELFTGNNMIIISVMEKEAKFSGMIRNWVIVYIGNFIGAVLIAALFVYGHTPSFFDEGLAAAVVNTAQYKVSLSFSDALIRGVLCNLLVCIAVWMSLSAKTVGGKIAGLYFPIMLFVLCGFEHCIANMYFIPAGIFAASEYGIQAGALSWGSFFLNNLLPVTLGNIISGTGIVALGYWSVYLRGQK
ncbi:MAG: formate/nitrite transporter family protein [Clostridiales bacterium]|nr:formate/nitrite transporter family protein [Clostridiales bacterium]